MPTSAEFLADVVKDSRRVYDEVRKKYTTLSARQLNWKPAPDAWSAAQVFDHLMVTASSYGNGIDAALRKLTSEKEGGQRELKTTLPGKFMLRMVRPDSVKKLKHPGVFQPAESELDKGVVERFLLMHTKRNEYFTACNGKDVSSVKVSSPAARFIRFTIGEALRILVSHEQRHLAQIERLVQHPQFPAE